MNQLSVSVLGAGTMGHGIAQVLAMASHSVRVYDVENRALQRGRESIVSNLTGGVERGKLSKSEMEGTLDQLSFTTDLDEAIADADLVIEAVPESMDLKQEMFTEVESIVDDSAVIATNTSSLSVTEIASVLRKPARAIGLHFFNPVHILSLVEIVVPEQASESTIAFATGVVNDIGKKPIQVRDSPGFASSRLGVALAAEAIRMLETDVASARDIDRAMTLGYNHPVGPLELTDMVGLDVRLDILEHLRDELGERFRPPQLLQQKVRAGKLGKKSGEGFYQWNDDGQIATDGEQA